MVRTGERHVRVVGGGRSSSKKGGSCSSSTASTSGATTSSKSSSSSSGGNPVCPRETPVWQQPIKNFFPTTMTKLAKKEPTNDNGDTKTDASTSAGLTNGSKPIKKLFPATITKQEQKKPTNDNDDISTASEPTSESKSDNSDDSQGSNELYLIRTKKMPGSEEPVAKKPRMDASVTPIASSGDEKHDNSISSDESEPNSEMKEQNEEEVEEKTTSDTGSSFSLMSATGQVQENGSPSKGRAARSGSAPQTPTSEGKRKSNHINILTPKRIKSQV